VDLFNFQTPRSIPELIAAKNSANAWLLAGGTDLIPQLKEDRRKAETIIDVKKIAAMTNISAEQDGGLNIGAAVTATTIAQSEIVCASYPALAYSVALIGSRQVQNRASLGGNVCNAAPSADAVPALMSYGALANIEGTKGKRSLMVEEIFTGPGRTVLEQDEVLASITLPALPENTAAVYQRFTPRREMDIAVAGVSSRITLDANSKIVDAKIALASPEGPLTTVVI